MQTSRAVILAAGSDTQPGQQFSPPAGFKAFTVRAEVADKLAEKLTLGTKVDVLLFPGVPDFVGPPKRVLAGLFVLPMSSVDQIDANTGLALPVVSQVTLAVTDPQVAVLCRADARPVPNCTCKVGGQI